MLVLLQLGNKFNLAKKGRNSVALTIALSAAALVGMTIVFIGIFVLFKSFFYIPLTRNFLFFLIILIQIMNIIASISSMTTSLYNSKDNPILLSMPAEHSEVFYSKLIVAYISEYFKNLLFVFPLMLAFGLITGMPLWFYIAAIIMTFVLPAISILISALLSIPLMYISKVFKKLPWIYILVIVGVAVGLFFGIHYLLGSLPDPVRLKAMYNAVMIAIDKSVSIIANNSLFYVWVSNIVFGLNGWMSALYLLLLVAVLFTANILLSRPLFFRIASRSAESARQKKHKGVNKNSKTTFGAFLSKEVTLSTRNIGVLMEEYGLIALMPFVLYLVNGFLNALVLSPLGKVLAIAINMILGLMFITASNQSAATSLSKEGGEFVLLKTAPSKTQLITWAKMTTNVIVSTIFIIISLVVIWALDVISPLILAQMFVTFIICNIAHILWSMQLDIKNPLMREYASTGGVTDNKNVSRSIAYGLVIALIVGIVSAVAYFALSQTIAFAMVTAFSLLLMLMRLYLFNLNLKCLFADLEF